MESFPSRHDASMNGDRLRINPIQQYIRVASLLDAGCMEGYDILCNGMGYCGRIGDTG